MALRTVGVRLTAEVAGYTAGMRGAGLATRDFARDLDKAARAGQLDAVASQASAMGIALVAGFGVAVGAMARFDKQMSEVAAITGATGRELDSLREAAMAAGESTQYSATQAAKAQAELAKAGLTTAEILGGALNGALSLAAAGSLDLAEAAEITAKTMNIFQLTGRDTGHIADLLAAAANKSATNVHELGEALKQGGLAANSAGVSVEETVGVLAMFADSALAGSDGGTSLKTAIMMLQAPTDKASALMKSLGINVYDTSGNFIGLEGLAGQLRSQLAHLTQEQRNAALAQIFGQDAMRAANVLYERGAEGVREYTDAVNDQGAAADVAAQKLDNLLGDIELLKSRLETLAIDSTSGANEGLRMLTQTTTALVGAVGQLPPALLTTATVAAGVTGAALLLGAGWVRTRRATADMREELRSIGPAGQRAARGLEATTKWAGRAAIGMAALTAANAAVSATQDKLNPQIDAMSKGLEQWGNNGKLAGEAARVLGDDMEKLNDGFKFLADSDNSRRNVVRWMQDILELIPGMAGTDTSLARTRERITAVDDALAQMVQSGNAQQAAAAFQRFAEQQAEHGVSLDEVKAKFPGYAAALETYGASAGKTADGLDDVSTAASIAAKQAEELKEAFDDLFDVQMSSDRLQIKLAESTRDLEKELRTGAKTLSVNSEEGRKNRTAVLDQIEAFGELREQRIAENMTVEEANKLFAKDIAALEKSAKAAGFTAKEIADLTAKYKGIPSAVATPVSAPGASGATAQVSEYVRWLNSIPPVVRTRIIAEQNTVRGGHKEFNPRRWGGITEHARDGLLREAHIASPMGPARYAYAEPATGGELFAPKYGDFERTKALVSYAVENWWGGWDRFVPAPAAVPASTSGTSRAGASAASGGAAVSPDQLARAIRSALIGTEVRLDGRAVGFLAGRDAEIYSR